MRLYRIWAVARKEFIHVIRDARSLGMAIAIPLLMLLLFGYALTLDVDHVPLVIWDQSQSPESRELISRFTGSRYFDDRARVTNYRDAERALDTRDALVVLVIPTDFATQVERNTTATAQLLVDGSDSNTATLAMGYADVVAQTYAQDLLEQQVKRGGGRALPPPIELVPRVWYNADLESRNYIVPGLIAVIMMVIAALLTSLTVAREWETGTMEQLIATPVKTHELIIGKMAPYFAIGMIDVLLAMGMGEVLFHVPMRGSVALVFAVSALFMFGALGQGLLISILTKNQLAANQMAVVSSFLPAFLLSGFTFAISNMPLPIQYVTRVVPSRYFVTLLRSIYLKGVGLELLWPEAALLAAFAAAVLLLAKVKFRKKLT